jgi:hypothetical protein
MARIESSVLVSKSVEDTFAFLNVPENHARFIPNMVEFNKTSSGVFGQVGTTIQGVLRFLGQKVNLPYEIIEHEPNRKLAMQGILGPVLFRDGYILSPTGNGTQIKFWLELTPTGLARIMTPFAGLIAKIHAAETLANLKRALELSQ